MAAGQGLLAQGVLSPSVAVLEARLAAGSEARHAVHAQLLVDALRLLRLYERAGQQLSVPPELARVWRCSEATAVALLHDAELLGSLPGAIPALTAGILTVEQSRAVRQELEPLPVWLRRAVWEQLLGRLEADSERGVAPTPGRARELVRTQVRRLDPVGVTARRKQACRDRAEVDVWRDPDGLVDLRLAAVSPPLAQAALLRIRALSAPIGPHDERTAGQRRRDAAIDLLLGRACLPLEPDADHPAGGSSGPDVGTGAGPGPGAVRPWCGCGAGHPVPCGAQVTVLVPLATALGAADDPAELLGHGPLDGDLLEDLLLAGPRLSVVFIDEHGTPVADSPTSTTPPCGDPAALRDALQDLAAAPPGPHQPRHPHDHQPPERRRPPDSGLHHPQLRDPHDPHDPGPYRVPGRMRRFLHTRASRCEWPGCGARANSCDQDHDLARGPDLPVQPRTAVPPAPPHEAARLDQDPPPRRHPHLDQPHREAAHHPQPAHRPTPDHPTGPAAARTAQPRPGAPAPRRPRLPARPARRRPPRPRRGVAAREPPHRPAPRRQRPARHRPAARRPPPRPHHLDPRPGRPHPVAARGAVARLGVPVAGHDDGHPAAGEGVQARQDAGHAVLLGELLGSRTLAGFEVDRAGPKAAAQAADVADPPAALAQAGGGTLPEVTGPGVVEHQQGRAGLGRRGRHDGRDRRDRRLRTR